MIYKKWRELSIDPYKINFKKIKLNEIISYLPAGNDVLECICELDGKTVNLILKVERSKMADFKSELETIKYLKDASINDVIPKIIEDGIIGDKRYTVLEKKEGRRLSEIFTNKNVNKNKYLYNYGKSLGKLHLLKPNNIHLAKQRIINDVPDKKDYKVIDKEIERYIKYLKENKPNIKFDTFIHGDYHYANVLWRYGKTSAVLDFEYSGLGFKEQDIAWAITLRPNQKFMNNINDIQEFLKGYLSLNTYDKNKLKWCLINASCHFYLMNRENSEYKNKLIKIISDIDKMVL